MEAFRSPGASGCVGGGRNNILNVSEDYFWDVFCSRCSVRFRGGVLGPGVGRNVPGEVILVWGMFWKSVLGKNIFKVFGPIRGGRGGRVFDGFPWFWGVGERPNEWGRVGRSAGQAVSQPASQSAWSDAHSVRRTPGQMPSQPVSQPVRLVKCSLGQAAVRQSGGRSVGQALGRSVKRSVGRSVGQAVGRSGGRSVGRSCVRSVWRSVGRSVGHALGGNGHQGSS